MFKQYSEGSNCTLLELKEERKKGKSLAPRRSNCTLLELKGHQHSSRTFDVICSNCTLLELKDTISVVIRHRGTQF